MSLGIACAGAQAAIFGRYEIQQELPVTTGEAQLARRFASRGPAAWKIPLGNAQIEALRWLDDELIYVGLREDSAELENLDHLVVQADTGKVVWRRERRADDRYTLLYGASDLLLFLVDEPRGRRRLRAITVAAGVDVWQLALERARDTDYVAPTIVPGADLVVTIDGRRGRAVGRRLSTGESLWERRLGGDGGSWQTLLSDGLHLWDPNGRLQRLDPHSGEVVWIAPGVTMDATVQPQLYSDGNGAQLLLAVAGSELVVLDAQAGERRQRAALPAGRVTSLFPQHDRVYVRSRHDASNEAHALSAIDLSDGRVLWSHSTPEPSLSNIVGEGPVVFHATSTTVYKLDGSSGQVLTATSVTDTGRTFPVRLRQVDDGVVYIGELVVAGIDAATGALTFRHGMTPISPETSLNALDYSIPRLQAEMGKADAGGTSFALNESTRFQNMANNYSRQAQSYRTQAFMARSSGSRSMADSAEFRALEAQGAANRASQQARTAATVEMSLAVMNLAIQLQEVWRRAGIKAQLDRQLLFRQSILAASAEAESADYVLRPHTRYRAADDHFAGVEIVHLSSGRARFFYLSAAYASYGVWNLLDVGRGRVIHHGVGLDPAGFTYGEPRRAAPMAPKVQHVESYLMAVPVQLP